MADNVLYRGLFVSLVIMFIFVGWDMGCQHIDNIQYDMINLFIFVGNWDILTLLVMRVLYISCWSRSGVNVIYGVMFVLVADLVVCIYVMYL